jgi:hypothetical protein
MRTAAIVACLVVIVVCLILLVVPKEDRRTEPRRTPTDTAGLPVQVRRPLPPGMSPRRPPPRRRRHG